jgi:hypothetical protein
MVLRAINTHDLKCHIENIQYRGKRIKQITADGYFKKIIFLYENIFNTTVKNDMIEFKLFNKFNTVYKWLENTYESLETRRSYVVGITAVYKATGKHMWKGKETATYRKYREYLFNLVNKLKEHRKTPEYKEEKCKITNEEINNKLVEMEKKYETKGDIKFLQNIILIKLYTEIAPVRADYVDTIITEQYNDKIADKRYNYADLKNGLFIIHNHKNEKAKGKITKKMTEDMKNLISKMYKQRINNDDLENSQFLLLTDKGNVMDANYLTKKIKRLTGCSITDLRKRYSTDKLGGVFQEIENVADEMGTSVALLKNVYTKN